MLHEQGQVPRCEAFPEPEPTEQEVLLTMRAASLKSLDRMMAEGSHYDHHEVLPAVVGIDGVGVQEDGTRVYSGGCRPPYGTMAERAVVPKAFRIPVPDTVDDLTAAALPNPAMSSWLALDWRARLQPGETVLVLGATGAAGRLAVQVARHLGAGRVIGAGRNPAELDRLSGLGVDAMIRLTGSKDEVAGRFVHEWQQQPFDIVLDYLWGPPAEALLDAITGHDVADEGRRVRYVQIGEMAGPTIALTAASLRSSGLELYGSGGGSVPHEVIFRTIPRLWELIADGTLHVETEAVPLADVADAWRRTDTGGRRLVIVP